jgi:Fe-S cluster biogenesis protein NfuA
MTANVTPEIADAVGELRAILRSDGADVEITKWEASTGVLSLRLGLETASCAECVLPVHDLEAVALRLVNGTAPEVTRVHVADPRVEGSGQT